jgi:hypothetical protein
MGQAMGVASQFPALLIRVQCSNDHVSLWQLQCNGIGVNHQSVNDVTVLDGPHHYPFLQP